MFIIYLGGISIEVSITSIIIWLANVASDFVEIKEEYKIPSL